ncbi:MAG: hypothetical protein ACI83B_002363 [Sediminicola sp.]|jgi:hypothetical protein
MTGKQIAKTGVEQIQFGTGGGFTGVETMYTLNQDGDIKDKSDTVLHNMSKKDVLEFFEKASKNKDIEFQKPENLYSLFAIITESDTNRIIWGRESTAVPPDILDLHKNLMNRTTKNK